MYQKRKIRKENREKNSKKQDNLQQVNINWEITTYGKLLRKAYK